MDQKEQSGLLHYLIQQCKNPTGFVGRSMIAIWNKTFPKMASWGLAHTVFAPNEIVLEVGFGGGMIIQQLVEKYHDITIYGVDQSEAAVAAAVKHNRTAIQKHQVFLSQCSVSEAPFQAHMFTKILAIQTHMYWPQIEQTLQKLSTLLQLRGELILICEKEKIAYHLPEYQNKAAMIDLLKHSGFQKVHSFETSQWIQYIGVKENV